MPVPLPYGGNPRSRIHLAGQCTKVTSEMQVGSLFDRRTSNRSSEAPDSKTPRRRIVLCIGTFPKRMRKAGMHERIWHAPETNVEGRNVGEKKDGLGT